MRIIPPFGGWRGLGIPAAILLLISTTAWASVWLKPRWAGALAAAVPVTLLALALIAIVLNLTGWWDGWICTGTDVRHYGLALARPNWSHVVPLAVGVYCFSCVCIIPLFMASNSTSVLEPWHAMFSALSVAIWIASLFLERADVELHSSRVLAEATLFWFFTARTVDAARSWFGREQPIGATRLLLRDGRFGRYALRVMLFVLGPVVTAAAVYWHAKNSFETAAFVWLPWYLIGVVVTLQWLDIDRQRFGDSALNSRLCCTRCGYDLRGTIMAERRVCPECGAGVTDDQYQWVREHVESAS